MGHHALADIDVAIDERGRDLGAPSKEGELHIEILGREVALLLRDHHRKLMQREWKHAEPHFRQLRPRRAGQEK